jgi:flagellar hook-associated protein 3 FlgL
VTGSTYTLQFTAGAGGTTYAVLKDGLPTAVTAAPYSSGQNIVVDGMSVKVSGTPATGNSFTIAPSSSSLSVFDVLDRAVVELDTTGRTNAQIQQANTNNLRDIDATMGYLQRARAVAGEALARVDNETGRLDGQKLAAQVERSAAEDLDMVEAISKFQNQQTGYDAALKSYSMVQRMTLFQYLS